MIQQIGFIGYMKSKNFIPNHIPLIYKINMGFVLLVNPLQ